MRIKDNVLSYLGTYGKENKYKLARALKIRVHEVAKALEALEKGGKIEVETGKAKLVKGKDATEKKAKKRKGRPKVKEIKEEQPQKESKETSEEEPKEEITEEKTEESSEVLEEKPKEEREEEEFPEEEPTEENIEEGKMRGRVKFYNPNKNFGFISGDDGNEYYVHKSGLGEGVVIKAGDGVSFGVVQGDKGPKAEEVENIS